jgi:hypothetical protein
VAEVENAGFPGREIRRGRRRIWPRQLRARAPPPPWASDRQRGGRSPRWRRARGGTAPAWSSSPCSWLRRRGSAAGGAALEAEAGVELLPLLVLAAPAWICSELEKEGRMRATVGTNGRPRRQPDGGMDASHRWKRSAAYLWINVGPRPFPPTWEAGRAPLLELVLPSLLYRDYGSSVMPFQTWELSLPLQERKAWTHTLPLHNSNLRDPVSERVDRPATATLPESEFGFPEHDTMWPLASRYKSNRSFFRFKRKSNRLNQSKGGKKERNRPLDVSRSDRGTEQAATLPDSTRVTKF